MLVYLQELVVALPVDSDADVDGDDGEYHARQGDGGELVDERHADVHDQRHHNQQARAVHSEVVEHDFGVLGEVAEYRQPRCHVRLRKTHTKKRTIIVMLQRLPPKFIAQWRRQGKKDKCCTQKKIAHSHLLSLFSGALLLSQMDLEPKSRPPAVNRRGRRMRFVQIWSLQRKTQSINNLKKEKSERDCSMLVYFVRSVFEGAKMQRTNVFYLLGEGESAKSRKY